MNLNGATAVNDAEARLRKNEKAMKEKIAELESSTLEQQQANESYLKSAERLKELIRKSER